MNYFIVITGARCGPFPLEELRRLEISTETLVWRHGMTEWTRANRVPELQELLATMPPPLAAVSPVPEQIVPTVSTIAGKKAWNPVSIAWLSILLTPFWAAGMAVVNGRRLGLGRPWWRPVGIVVAYLLIDLLTGLWFESYAFDLAIYLIAVGLIWQLELRLQMPAYAERFANRSESMANWIWPSIVGIPFAVLVIAAFVISPLLPLEPREVCERFIHASTVNEAKKYATLKLLPAIEAMMKLSGVSGRDAYELTEEGPAPVEIGGYIVGLQTVSVENGQRHRVDGLFHLVDWSGEWKIDDVYLTQVNGQQIDPWMAISVDYPRLLTAGNAAHQQGTGHVGGPIATTATSTSKSKNGWEMSKSQLLTIRVILAFLVSGAGKKVGIVIVGLGAIAARLAKRATKDPASEPAPPESLIPLVPADS